MHNKHRNIRKAAILVASLDADNSQTLLRQMSAGQAQLVRQEIDRLGPIDPAEQEAVVAEFFRIGPLVPDKQPSGIELDGRLPKHLSMSSADRELPADERWAHGALPFRFLHDASAQSLAPFLQGEHPQIIAVVVSHLPSDQAADVLAGLPAELQIEVARRLVDLDETDPDILRDVERGLETWLCQQVRNTRRRAAGMTALKSILGAASPQAKQHLLANLIHHDYQLAGKLRAEPSRAFSFAELQQMDRASLSVVLHHAEPELVALALAGANEDFVDRVLDLVPSQQVEELKRATRELGPTRLTDVEEAQLALAELASHLESNGQIVPRVSGRLSVAV